MCPLAPYRVNGGREGEREMGKEREGRRRFNSPRSLEVRTPVCFS